MKLTKERKGELISQLKDLFGSRVSIASNYSGLTAKELTELRKNLVPKGIHLIVTKNALVAKALADLKIEMDQAILNQPVIFAFGDDEVEVSKEIFEFTKAHENLEIVGGVIDSKGEDAAKFKILALLPGREELQVKLVGILSGPTYGLVNVLHGNIRGLVNILGQYKNKIEG